MFIRHLSPPHSCCRYGTKGLASLTYSMTMEGPVEGTIRGDKGTIVLHHQAHCPTSLTFTPTGRCC